MVFNMMYVLAVILFAHQAAGILKAHFPLSNETSYPRLVFRHMPTMSEFTFCAWVRPLRLSVEYPYIFSYATARAGNDLTVLLQRTTDGSILGYVQMADPFASFKCSAARWEVGAWQHVCVSWLGSDGKTKFYANGRECTATTSSYISPYSYVLGGGVAMLGQDQNAVGGKFEAHQSWFGDISDVHLWDELLSDDLIEEIAKCGSKEKEGNIIAWSKTRLGGYDGVSLAECVCGIFTKNCKRKCSEVQVSCGECGHAISSQQP